MSLALSSESCTIEEAGARSTITTEVDAVAAHAPDRCRFAEQDPVGEDCAVAQHVNERCPPRRAAPASPHHGRGSMTGYS